jgi:chromosome segregation ATPase
MDLTKFDLLESKIQGLVDRLKEAEKKTGALEAELEDVKGRLEASAEERAAVLKKIDELIARLDI